MLRADFERKLLAHVRVIQTSLHLDRELESAANDSSLSGYLFSELHLVRRLGLKKVAAVWSLHLTRRSLSSFLKRNPEFAEEAVHRVGLVGRSHGQALQRSLQSFWQRWFFSD